MSRLVLLLLALGLPLASAADVKQATPLAGGKPSRGPGPEHLLKPGPSRPLPLHTNRPATAQLQATRMGRLLALDYRLLDDSGKNSLAGRQRPIPPCFTVSQGGRQVGSGTFEYG
jgi:hypothetical protein